MIVGLIFVNVVIFVKLENIASYAQMRTAVYETCWSCNRFFLVISFQIWLLVLIDGTSTLIFALLFRFEIRFKYGDLVNSLFFFR